MQGRPPVFFMRSIMYRAAHKKKNGHSGMLLPKSGCEMLHLCSASGNVISQQQKQKQESSCRQNGYTTFSARKCTGKRI